MDKLKKFALMEKISHELEDLKNSQVAVLNKMAKIEIDNMELNNKKLEDKLPDMHQSAADMVDSIQEILSDFESIKSSYESKNNIDALKEQELVNSVKQKVQGLKYKVQSIQTLQTGYLGDNLKH